MTKPVVLTHITSTSSRILSIRGKRVILDSDLAELYGVPTKRLNEQVRRNHKRFPADFAFLLSADEWDSLRPQIATLNRATGGTEGSFPTYSPSMAHSWRPAC